MRKELSKRKLSAVILSCAFIAGPQMALAPGIAKTATEAFPQYPLTVIQAVIMLPCLIIVFTSFIGAVFVRAGAISRKALILTGIVLYSLSGVFILCFHTEFWHIIAAGILLGFGMGFNAPVITSIMMDSYDGDELAGISGLQAAFVGLGGIAMSFFAGLLVTLIWFGGYIMLLPALPVLLITALLLPGKKAVRHVSGGRFIDINSNVLYYSVFASLLFVMAFAAFPNNFSSHLQASGYANYSSLAGTGIAVNLIGAAIAGFVFKRVSLRLGDYTVALAYLLLAAGFFILSLFAKNYTVVLAGAFISGLSQCLASPQGVVSISRYTSSQNSFFATMLFNCVFNGLAGFLSAPVFTGITEALAPGDTVFRFEFVAVCALVMGILFALLTLLRTRRGIAWK